MSIKSKNQPPARCPACGSAIVFRRRPSESLDYSGDQPRQVYLGYAECPRFEREGDPHYLASEQRVDLSRLP